jgi:hypothetical protein
MDQKRYWFRGGIIGLILGMVVLIFAIIYGLAHFDCISCATPFWMDFVYYVTGAKLIISAEVLLPRSLEIMLLLLFPVMYTIGGSIIGWVYGRTRNR